MKHTYDRHADAAYIQLVDAVHDGEASKQTVVPLGGTPSELVLDLDADGRLLGVEILMASAVLRAETLDVFAPLSS